MATAPSVLRVLIVSALFVVTSSNDSHSQGADSANEAETRLMPLFASPYFDPADLYLFRHEYGNTVTPTLIQMLQYDRVPVCSRGKLCQFLAVTGDPKATAAIIEYVERPLPTVFDTSEYTDLYCAIIGLGRSKSLEAQTHLRTMVTTDYWKQRELPSEGDSSFDNPERVRDFRQQIVFALGLNVRDEGHWQGKLAAMVPEDLQDFLPEAIQMVANIKEWEQVASESTFDEVRAWGVYLVRHKKETMANSIAKDKE